MDDERYFSLLQVVATAVAVDETVAQALSAAHRAYRAALGVVAGRLATRGELREGLTRSRATDILWFCLGRHSRRLYVSDAGWSWDDAEGARLTEQVSVALLK